MSVRAKSHGGSGRRGPGQPGGCPPGFPQIRTCPIKAYGSSATDYATRRRHEPPAGPRRYPLEFCGHAERLQSAWRVSLQRAHGSALPSLHRVQMAAVPLVLRYYEVLRPPVAHFAALRFLRLAIPCRAPVFVPASPTPAWGLEFCDWQPRTRFCRHGDDRNSQVPGEP
jgi:hypothetical protein